MQQFSAPTAEAREQDGYDPFEAENIAAQAEARAQEGVARSPGEAHRKAVSRLRVLPDVFSAREAEGTFGWAADTARKNIKRWHQARLIAAAGPRLGLYYNLVRNPNAPRDYLGSVIQRTYPGAVVIGKSALVIARWSSPKALNLRKLVVAVPSAQTYARIHHVALKPRSKFWYQSIEPWLRRRGRALVPVLDPAMALADAMRHDDWRPGLDDLAIPGDPDTLFQLAQAFSVAGINPPQSETPTTEDAALQSAIHLDVDPALEGDAADEDEEDGATGEGIAGSAGGDSMSLTRKPRQKEEGPEQG